jgi:hypothetical protein
MTRLDDLLYDAMGDPEHPPQPSSDLFARVVGSIAEDRERRRRRRRIAAIVAIVALAVAASTVINKIRQLNGEATMPWWSLEIVTTAVLVGLALWLGPLIKRFGRAYAADVFHDNPRTGKSYIVLTDIVYYLIFAAYILFTVRVESPTLTGDVDAGFVRQELVRLGGILLIIGVLHGLNIVLMPMLGRLFSLNRRLTPGSDSDRDR